MAISFPRRVTFQNARLQAFSWCLHITCGILILLQLMYFGNYHEIIKLSGNVQLQPDYNKTISHATVSGGPQVFCDSPELFDYWRDADGILRYDNHSCVPICVPGYSNPCLKDTHVVFSDGPHTMFVATQIQDKLKVNSTVHNYFVSSAEAASMRLTVDYNWPHMPWFSSNSGPDIWDRHSSSKDAHLHLLNKKGQQVKSFAPGSAIVLSVSEIVDLAGVDSLDIAEPLAGVNYMPTAGAVVTAGPSRRLAGMQLDIQVECGGSSSQNTDCKLRVFVQPGAWISSSTLCNLFVGDSVYRICHGLRIRAAFAGEHHMINVNSVFINLCSCAVFFRLPRALVLVTALYLCGHLSTIYRRVVHYRFSITAEAAAMSMRLLEHESNFSRLESETSSGTLAGNISKEDVGRSLHHVLERRKCLDDVEIKLMTDFVLAEVTRGFGQRELDDGGLDDAFMTATCEGLNNFWASLKESVGIINIPNNHKENLHVDVDTFMGACSSSDPISFNNLVKLFDGDRKGSFMERFFMPIRFKMSLAAIKKYQGTRDTSKSEYARRKSNTMASPRTEIEAEHEIIKSLSSEIGAEHEVIHNVVEELSEERRAIDMLTEKMDVLTLRLDELQRQLHSEQTHALQEGTSEERSKMDIMTERIDVLALRLDELQRKLALQHPYPLLEGASEDLSKIDMTTERFDMLTVRLDELEKKQAFATLQASHEAVSELRYKMDNTERINELMLRLDKQQHEHEIEQIKAWQEISELKKHTKQSVQMIASLQVLGLEALEKEKSESSSISMHGVEKF